MYITIKTVPTQEQIKQFHTTVAEEDSFINYRVDLTKFDAALRTAFAEAFQIDAAAIEGRHSVTLTRSNEV